MPETLVPVSVHSADAWSVSSGVDKVAAVASLGDPYIFFNGAAGTKQSFDLADTAVLDPADTITDVTFYAIARKNHASPQDLYLSVSDGTSTELLTPSLALPDAYDTLFWVMTGRPNAAGPWTQAHVDAIFVELELGVSSREGRIDQLWAVVNFISFNVRQEGAFFFASP